MRSLRTSHQRRGIAVVYVALAAVVVIAMAALSIDMGTAYTARNELQRAADAGALASALLMIEGGAESDEAELIARASEAVEQNIVHGDHMALTSDDVELGKAVLVGDRFEFQAGPAPWDAVKVNLARGGGGYSAIPTMFGKMLGRESFNVRAESTAMLVPRDIALVIDLSGSMNYDSRLLYWDRTDGGFSNARDIWAAMDGPAPSRPYMPGAETDTEYAGDSGPTFGLMNNWGAPLLPGTYDVGSDPGLFYIKKGSTTTNSAVKSYLSSRGYSADEQSILLSGGNDGNADRYMRRVCVLLGLAEWRSGRAGGKYGAGNGGNGNGYVDSNELTAWVGYPAVRAGGWDWYDYVNYVYNQIQNDRSEFRYRFGLKTFVDYLLKQEREAHRTELWATPQLPLTAVKDSVQVMVDTITSEAMLDQVSLEIFATTGQHEVDLTENLQTVADTLYDRQAAHYNPNTAIASGIVKALSELQSERARDNASKLIILMSDGVPNTDEDGNWVSGSAAGAYALDRAQEAADRKYTIYTVSVGYGVDRELMQQIAAIGGGQEFYAAGSPEEYHEDLEEIFEKLGGLRPVALID